MRRVFPPGAVALIAALAAALLLRARAGGEPAPAAGGREEPLAVGPPSPRGPPPRPLPGTSGAPAPSPAPERSPSPVVRTLAERTARELALLARFERLTGRPAPPALLELLERRRAGARSEELVALATRRLEGDPLGRAAVLAWLREGDPRR